MIHPITIDDLIAAASSAFHDALEVSCGGPDDDCGDRLVYEVHDTAMSQFKKKLQELKEKAEALESHD